jgi:hypothetical protein
LLKTSSSLSADCRRCTAEGSAEASIPGGAPARPSSPADRRRCVAEPSVPLGAPGPGSDLETAAKD